MDKKQEYVTVTVAEMNLKPHLIKTVAKEQKYSASI